MTDESPGADFIDEAERGRREGLPEHERDDDTSAGGDPDVATGMVAGTPASGAQPFAPVFVEENAEEGALPDEDQTPVD